MPFSFYSAGERLHSFQDILLPGHEKEVFTAELLARAQAQGLPVPLLVERALQRTSQSSMPSAHTTSDRVNALRTWAASHPDTPPLPDAAIRRESLYGDRG
jgi:hypothetical protein